MSQSKTYYIKNNRLNDHIHNLRSFTPTRILAFGFVGLILIGGVLLSIPYASENGLGTPFIDALFTSTSAVCVTGLVVLDTANHFSTFGEIIILFLIQIGGLGFMTFATFFAILLGRKINLRERIILQESLNQISLEGIVKLVKHVLLFSFTIEGLGAGILFVRWFTEMGWQKSFYFAVFHSISSFNNAGFDLMGNFSSLSSYKSDVVVNITIMSLIITGGLGFAVLADLYSKKNKKFTLHTRLVLKTTAILIIVGFLVVFFVEMNNPKTLGGYDLFTKIQASLFHSVTTRTAGFNTLDIQQLRPATLFVTMFLMFIGASPGSTGGGIKTTTFVSILLFIRSIFYGHQYVTIEERTLPYSIIRKSFAIVTLAIFWVSITIGILLLSEQAPFVQIVFETISAFGTVGLSMGLTPHLTVIGKIVIMITMFFGRVGLITIALALGLNNKNSALSHIKYPEEKIMIG
ncbi:MAG: TrkH family potassium uptake protein [Eubacteriales bacterium]